MRLIKPSTEILAITPNALKLIEAAGRTCYKSEDKITITSAGNFVAMILNRGHDSVLEHASATVRFICDRGVSHEIVRHRIASYSQESTRYCNYGGKDIVLIHPPGLTEEQEVRREELYWRIQALYDLEISEGLRPEIARGLLPNSLKTEIVMTANLREWRHFFKLRTAPAAHPQMRELTIPLLAKFQREVPVIFDDLAAVKTPEPCHSNPFADCKCCE